MGTIDDNGSITEGPENEWSIIPQKMARYRPDRRLQRANEIIDELGDSERDGLIKYFIAKKQETIDKQKEKLDMYGEFFRIMNGFLPNKNPIRKIGR